MGWVSTDYHSVTASKYFTCYVLVTRAPKNSPNNSQNYTSSYILPKSICAVCRSVDWNVGKDWNGMLKWTGMEWVIDL